MQELMRIIFDQRQPDSSAAGAHLTDEVAAGGEQVGARRGSRGAVRGADGDQVFFGEAAVVHAGGQFLAEIAALCKRDPVQAVDIAFEKG